jgi:uncharacterized protein (TIGR02145 family)
MKKYLRIAFASLLAASFFSCKDLTENAEMVSGIETELVFMATQESLSPVTKTIRKEDGSTWWNTDEEISVFCNNGTNGGSKFVSQNTSSEEIVEFSGTIQGSGLEDDFWAVYPYSVDNSCDGSSVTTVIPAVQTASEGNFSGDAFPMIAKSNTSVLAFWNICGGVKISVSRNDIKSITFKGNGGETLAGKVRLSFDADGKPTVEEIIESEKEITLNAPDGGSFKPGDFYYLTILPVSLDSGISMSFNTESTRGIIVSDKAQNVKRSVFGLLNNVDSYAEQWRAISVPEPDMVDLGLSVKWASWNVGASSEEEFGICYAWGETGPKYNYVWETYKWCNGSKSSLTKYNYDSSYGTVDDLTTLEKEDDVAYVNWGEKWRTPTKEEWIELLDTDNCTWTWTTQNGVNGYLVTSNKAGYTDKFLFLPAAGRMGVSGFMNDNTDGFYWSSSLGADFPYGAWYVDFNEANYSLINNNRCYGRSVRAVYNDGIHPESVSLNKTSLTLYVGDSEQLTATVSPSNATDQTVSWLSDNTDVASVDADGNVTGMASGYANVSVTTIDGQKTASCLVTVKAKPDTDFNESSYLIWKSNASITDNGEDYIKYETHFTGFSASVVELKFQLASSTSFSSPIASSGNMAKDYGYSYIMISDKYLTWSVVRDEDEDDDYLSIKLSDAGVSSTSLMTIRFDGPARTITINGHSFSSTPFTSFSFTRLFSKYYRERDEGLYESLSGIPNNSVIYYCKGWDSSGTLVYLGHPAKAVNPESSKEEYCWYTYNSGFVTYQFANESKKYGGFGGMIYK